MSHTPETGDPATISSEHGFTHRVLAAVEESSATRQWQEIPA